MILRTCCLLSGGVHWTCLDMSLWKRGGRGKTRAIAFDDRPEATSLPPSHHQTAFAYFVCSKLLLLFLFASSNSSKDIIYFLEKLEGQYT